MCRWIFVLLQKLMLVKFGAPAHNSANRCSRSRWKDQIVHAVWITLLVTLWIQTFTPAMLKVICCLNWYTKVVALLKIMNMLTLCFKNNFPHHLAHKTEYHVLRGVLIYLQDSNQTFSWLMKQKSSKLAWGKGEGKSHSISMRFV